MTWALWASSRRSRRGRAWRSFSRGRGLEGRRRSSSNRTSREEGSTMGIMVSRGINTSTETLTTNSISQCEIWTSTHREWAWINGSKFLKWDYPSKTQCRCRRNTCSLNTLNRDNIMGLSMVKWAISRVILVNRWTDIIRRVGKRNSLRFYKNWRSTQHLTSKSHKKSSNYTKTRQNDTRKLENPKINSIFKKYKVIKFLFWIILLKY